MMKALSLLPPWGHLMALNEKIWETRSWATSHRGELAICSSARWDKAGLALIRTPECKAVMARHGITDPVLQLELGVVLCVSSLKRILKTQGGEHPDRTISQQQVLLRDEQSEITRAQFEWHFGNYAAGRSMWECQLLKKLAQAIPVKGKQSLFELPPEVEKAVRAQL